MTKFTPDLVTKDSLGRMRWSCTLPNGFIVSVICGPGTYSHEGVYEVAVIRPKGPKSCRIEEPACYCTPSRVNRIIINTARRKPV